MERPVSHGNPVSRRSSVPSIHPSRPHPADRRTGDFAALQFARPDAGNKYRVLLAHDLTGASEVAFVRAARLTRERDGHLTILHVVESELPAKVIEAQRAQARNVLESQARRWLGCARLSYRIDIGIGDRAGAIAARAQAQDADLVVTGRHPRRAFADMHASSMIGRLLYRVRRPILVVGNRDQTPYRRVLIPMAFTGASAARIQFAATFLPQAHLHLLHACKKRFEDHIASISRPLHTATPGVIGPSQEAWCAFVATLQLGMRKPMVTSQYGDSLVLVKAELGRQKTDLLVWGIDPQAGMESGAAELAVRSSSCDVLFQG
jgi:hypothetical protein